VLSPEGALFLKGRVDDMINFDGMKIYPADIEMALQQHPAVAEAAPSRIVVQGYRQVPVAVVILQGRRRPGARCLCRGRSSADPRVVPHPRWLPRNAIGKVLKRELAERFSP